MVLRFRKSITLCKGVKLNFGKSGMSLSAGVPGFHKTFHSSGRVTTSVGLPGTGLSYVTTENRNRTRQSSTRSSGQANNLPSNYDYEPEYDATFGQSTSTHSSQTEESSVISRQEIASGALKSIHKISDYPVDWTDVLVNSLPPDDMYDQELWSYYHSVAADILNGDIDAYLKVIQDVNPLDDLLDFGSDFEFGTDNPSRMEVEFQVKSVDLVPSKTSMSTAAYYDLLQDYVCSCAVRVARDMLALLPVKAVIVHAEDNKQTILSVCFDRQTMTGIKFHIVDPSDVIMKFEHHMEFNPSRGFSPVSRVEK